MKYYAIMILTVLSLELVAQDQDKYFSVEVSHDSVLSGNIVELSFVARNISGRFEGPDLKGFQIISGPNSSTSMSMINGEVTQYGKYSYMILTEEIGELLIPPAYFIDKDQTFESEPISILVLPNPEGIIEESPTRSGFYQFEFPSQPKNIKPDTIPKSSKKKRKLRKI